jgi:hypothetical protein
MTVQKIKKIISTNKKNIAFVIGNGINRYPNNPNGISWEGLLINLWNEVLPQPLKKCPSGISLTEFYDILELENTKNLNLQKEVVNLIKNWQPLNHHKIIVDKIHSLDAPILTTNFEETFNSILGLKLFRTEQKNFTDFYPWIHNSEHTHPQNEI